MSRKDPASSPRKDISSPGGTLPTHSSPRGLSEGSMFEQGSQLTPVVPPIVSPRAHSRQPSSGVLSSNQSGEASPRTSPRNKELPVAPPRTDARAPPLLISPRRGAEVRSPSLSPRSKLPDEPVSPTAVVPKTSPSVDSATAQARPQLDGSASALPIPNGGPARTSWRSLKEKESAKPCRAKSLQEIGFFMGSPLHGHARKGDLAEIKKACTTRRQALSPEDYTLWMNANTNKNLQTALHVAIQHGHTEAARLLVSLGCALSSKDVNGRTPFLYTARYGNVPLALEYLQTLGVKDANEEADAHGDRALHLACANSQAEIVKALVPRGLDVNALNPFGETPLHKAARVNNLELCGMLLGMGANPNILGRGGKARHVATDERIVRLFKEQKSESGSPASLGSSPAAQGKKSVPVPSPLRAATSTDAVEDVGVDLGGEGDEHHHELSLLDLEESDPDSEAIHFKLKRKIQRDQSSPFMNGDTILITEEELASIHAEIASKSSATTSITDSDVFSPPPDGSGVVVELSLAAGSRMKAARIAYLFEPYRVLFGKRHWNFAIRNLPSGSSGSLSCAIISIPTVPEGGSHVCLLRTENGYSIFEVPLADIRAEMDATKSTSEVEAFRTLLDKRLAPSSSAGAALLSPRGSRISRVFKPSKDKSSSPLFSTWTLVEDTSLNYELLALELKLNLPKTLAVGVIFVLPGQDENAAMSNSMSKEVDFFLSKIASPIETRGWSGYAGGLSTNEHTTMYYSSWQGFEIAFHVSPLLTAAQRRQFVGNDKVVLYLLGSWTKGAKLVPVFRGHVNSAGIVVRPSTSHEGLFYLNCFHRAGMDDVAPAFVDEPVSLDDPQVRDYFMSKIVNAHVGAYKLLYGERMKRAWSEELATMVEKQEEGPGAVAQSGGKGSKKGKSTAAKIGGSLILRK